MVLHACTVHQGIKGGNGYRDKVGIRDRLSFVGACGEIKRLAEFCTQMFVFTLLWRPQPKIMHLFEPGRICNERTTNCKPIIELIN